jgi:AhpD family alkylhydroperoxidase
MDEHKHLYVTPSAELSGKRAELAPEVEKAFHGFSRAVFAPGALDAKTKQLIAVATAHVTQCPYCIRAHTKAALRAGASQSELMEAFWVAAEMRAGAAIAHGVIALDVMHEESTRHS